MTVDRLVPLTPVIVYRTFLFGLCSGAGTNRGFWMRRGGEGGG